MNRKRKILFLLTAGCMAALVLVCPQDVRAYGYQIKKSNGTTIVWPVKSIHWSAGNKSFPAGSPWRSGLVESNSIWNQTPAAFTFGIAKWGDTSLRRGNGQNEAWFSNNQSVLKGAPALCYRWKYASGSRLWWSEADIIFDAGEPWSPSTLTYNTSMLWPYGGPNRPFVTTAVHEMGHAMGLNHENRFYNIMGQDYTHVQSDGITTRGYAGSDGTQGALFLYGKSPQYGSKEDVAVTHWKYGGKKGEYSKHTPTVMYYQNSPTSMVSNFPLDGFPRFQVLRGASYHTEFTYQNTGYSNHPAVKTAWYISTNRIISTSDRLIGATQINLPAGAVWTTTVLLTIPADLKPGMTYYLGVIVDYENNIAEFDETNNNATYLQIRIIP